MKSRLKTLAFLFVGLGFLMSCHSQHHDEEGLRKVVVEDPPREVKMPTALWDLIEGVHDVQQKKDPAVSEEAELMGTRAVEAHFSPLTVLLVEKNEGVLKDAKKIRIELPRGGGRIDLADYLSGESGSFFVSFEFSAPPDGQIVEAWYVSQARARRLDGEVWGAGCRHFFKVKDLVWRSWQSEGLKVNTTRFRHLSVLAGHFVFSTRSTPDILLSQVTFTDSRATHLLCEAL